MASYDSYVVTKPSSDPGTYAIILCNDVNASVRIGRWQEINLEPGFYIYVGSAFGPGGVRARLSRHWRTTKSKHWHIDYLRELLNPIGAWYTHEVERLEHRWADAFDQINGISAINGFGCSDCRCKSHLFWTPTQPDFVQFSQVVGGDIESWPSQSIFYNQF